MYGLAVAVPGELPADHVGIYVRLRVAKRRCLPKAVVRGARSNAIRRWKR